MIRLIKFLKRYLFRKDIHFKLKERVIYYFRKNFKDAYKDQKHLLGYIDNIIIFDVGSHIGNTVKKYKSVFHSNYEVVLASNFLVSYFLEKKLSFQNVLVVF